MHLYNTCPKKLALAMPFFAGGQVRSREVEKDGFIYEHRGKIKGWRIDDEKYEIRFRLSWWCKRGVGTDKDFSPRTIWTPVEIVPDRELVVCFGPLDFLHFPPEHYYYFQRERKVGTLAKPARKKRIKIQSSLVETVHVFMQYDPTNITETDEGEFLPCPDYLEKEDPDD